MRQLEAMLQREYHISHGEFEVLLRLSWAEDHRMRIRDLADDSVLTRSGMSRLVDRLEQAGMVRREVAAEDARGAYAVMTPLGQERLAAAEASNIALVNECFLSLYSEAELEQMGTFWGRFLDRQQQQPDADRTARPPLPPPLRELERVHRSGTRSRRIQ